MTSMPFLTPFRLFGSTRLVGLVFVIWGMVASIQSVPMRAEEGVDSNASGSGPKTNIDDEPGLLMIEGTVVDENGDPVPKTRVRLYSYDLMGEVPAALSDAQGRFRFSTNLATMWDLVFVADNLKDGRKAYAGTWEEETLGLPAPLKLVLKPPRVLEVEVRDSRGEPVGDADVEALGEWSSLAHGRSAPDGSLRLTVPVDAKVESVFALKSGLGFDCGISRVNPDGAVQGFPEKLSLTLDGSRRVLIHVRDSAGHSISGITVRPWRVFKQGRSFCSNFASGTGSHFGTAVTDAKGIATFDWLPIDFEDDIQFLTWSEEFYLPKRTSVENDKKDDVELTMNLLRRTKMSGIVLAEEGTPVEGIIVQAEGRGQQYYFREMARTNAAGRFQFKAHPDQAYLVGVLDNQWGALSQIVPNLVEGEPVTGIKLRLSQGTVVRGTVTDAEGRARSNVTVELSEWAESPGPDPMFVCLDRSAKTDSEGRYQFRLGSGTFDLFLPDDNQSVRLEIEEQREVVQDFRVK